VGEPAHIELRLDGFTLGIATLEAAREHHGLRTEEEGRRIEIVLWTDDTDSAVSVLVAKGAPLLSAAHDFLDGKLRAAWIADPDGNPIQLVQRKGWTREAGNRRRRAHYQSIGIVISVPMVVISSVGVTVEVARNARADGSEEQYIVIQGVLTTKIH
jgi:hypothetical protein